MKLLLDQNLSPRLLRSLAEIYPSSVHVSIVGLERAKDQKVWDYARDHGYILVSKDSDFSDLSLLRGFPPKVVWIRRGNCSTKEIESLLREGKPLLEALVSDPELGVLLLS